MNKIVCFKKEESCYHPGKWIISPILENFNLSYTEGSFNIIAARLMNLTYAQYLRMCRDVFGAVIIGKNSYYPVAYFNNDEKLKALLDNLNARANIVLWNKEHQNYNLHEQYVKEQNPRFYNKVVSNGY